MPDFETAFQTDGAEHFGGDFPKDFAKDFAGARTELVSSRLGVWPAITAANPEIPSKHGIWHHRVNSLQKNEWVNWYAPA